MNLPAASGRGILTELIFYSPQVAGNLPIEIKVIGLLLMFVPFLFSCQKEKRIKQNKTRVGFNFKKTAFQKVINGKKTNLYFLKNHNHVQVAITNYGARIVGILTPDRNWHFADIVLGHDSLGGYLSGTDNYFGAIIGRYSNRIAKGTFKLDGKTYHIPINDPPNSLHGGTKGFDSRIWDVRQLNDQNLLLTCNIPTFT